MRRPPLHDLHGKHVVITGAASGIGHSLALACAARGAHLHLTDVRADDLAALAGRLGAASATAADITDLAAVQAFADRVHAHTDAVDVVANVAGISTWGTVDRLEHRHWRALVEVDLMGPIQVIECFVPAMIAGGRGGQLVNVSSAAGLIGLPWHAAYSAAKFGLRGVSEVLRFDLARHGIGVSLVCPGAVATGLTETVTIVGVDAEHPRVRKLRERFVRHAATADEVAETILRAIRRNTYLVHTARDVQAAFLLQRYLPPVYALAMRTLNDQLTRAAAPALLPREQPDTTHKAASA